MGLVSHYLPFIDDPGDLARFQRQRYVVLRPFGGVAVAFDEVKQSLRDQFADWPVSYIARPHVTLAGFPAGTDLDAVRRLVARWASTVSPLEITVERVSFFPFRIAILEVRKTPELSNAMTRLRQLAEQDGPRCFTAVPVENWIFHTSVAYCSSLTDAAWSEMTAKVETMRIRSQQCSVEAAEVVAFDDGEERSGGVYSFARPAAS